MKVLVVVQARTGSSRLPDKVTLPLGDRTLLEQMLRRVTEAGGAALFISHHLNEVLSLCDRVTVLRDGRVVLTEGCAGLTEAEINYLMSTEWARTTEDVIWRRSKLGLRLTPSEVAALDAWMLARASALQSEPKL